MLQRSVVPVQDNGSLLPVFQRLDMSKMGPSEMALFGALHTVSTTTGQYFGAKMSELEVRRAEIAARIEALEDAKARAAEKLEQQREASESKAQLTAALVENERLKTRQANEEERQKLREKLATKKAELHSLREKSSQRAYTARLLAEKATLQKNYDELQKSKASQQQPSGKKPWQKAPAADSTKPAAPSGVALQTNPLPEPLVASAAGGDGAVSDGGAVGVVDPASAVGNVPAFAGPAPASNPINRYDGKPISNKAMASPAVVAALTAVREADDGVKQAKAAVAAARLAQSSSPQKDDALDAALVAALAALETAETKVESEVIDLAIAVGEADGPP